MAVSPLIQQFLGLQESLAPRLAPIASRMPRTVSAGPTYPRTGSHSSVSGYDGLSPDEAWIIQRESGGRTDRKNPTSTAFGLGQLILANRRKYGQMFGFDPNTTDYDQQLQMFRRYVQDRYGDAARARQFWERNRWY